MTATAVQNQITSPAVAFQDLGSDLAQFRQIVLFIINKENLQEVVRTMMNRHLDAIEEKKKENQEIYTQYSAFCAERMRDDLLVLSDLPDYLKHQLDLQNNLTGLRELVTNFVTKFAWTPEAEHKKKVCLTKINFLLENCSTRLSFLKAAFDEVDWTGLPPKYFDRTVGFVW